MNSLPLSEIIYSMLLYSEMIDSRAENIVWLGIDGYILNTGKKDLAKMLQICHYGGTVY